MRSINEECGVFGIYSPETTDVAADVYNALFALQHRGQESSGIVVCDDGVFRGHKAPGIANDVFDADAIASLGQGSMAVGHVRYGTANTKGVANAQPMVINHVKGHLAIAHNGSIVNAYELRRSLELQGSIFHTNSDTEVIAYMITKARLNCGSIEEAVNIAMNDIKGAYSLVIMSPSKLIAVRDPNGIHPLCYGKCEDGRYVVASESCALDAVGAVLIREIEPGEIMIFDKSGIRSIKDHCGKVKKATCIFEYIYFARPDSVIDGVSVHESRVRAGQFLAQDSAVDADVVFGVPDSGIDAAIGYSKASGIPYEVGLIKNRYVARTFIYPTQKMRENSVRLKLNAISSVLKGKRVVMVDDSIVRGTTSARIVKLVREAGAKEIHMRISSPEFLNPCYYGTDIDSKENLIACKHSVDEIAKIIGVDSLAFLSCDRLGAIIGRENGDGYCDACFTANYPTDIPPEIPKSKFEFKISQGMDSKLI